MPTAKRMNQERMRVLFETFGLRPGDIAEELRDASNPLTPAEVVAWFHGDAEPSRSHEKHLFEMYRLALGVGTLPEGTWGERENNQIDLALQDATGPGRVLRRIGGVLRDMGAGMLPAIQSRAAAILEGAEVPGFPEAAVLLGRARSFGLTQVQNRMQVIALLDLQPGQEDDSPFVWFVEVCPFCGNSHALFAGQTMQQVREEDHESFKEMPCGQGIARIVETGSTSDAAATPKPLEPSLTPPAAADELADALAVYAPADEPAPETEKIGP